MLVLATLGVYFGLGLAGSTPQILAQAAMAKQFDAKDEIGRTDDLEKKPDDKRSPLSTSVQIYLEDVENFLASLTRLTVQGKFDAKKDTFDLVQTTLLPCIDSNLAGRYTPIRFETSSEAARSPLTYFSRGMTYGYSLGDCVPNSEFNGVEAVDSRFSFKLNEKGLTASLEVKKSSEINARQLFDALNATLKLYAASETTKLRRSVIDHTRFSFRDSQAMINLHLARSDLDSLLVSSAK